MSHQDAKGITTIAMAGPNAPTLPTARQEYLNDLLAAEAGMADDAAPLRGVKLDRADIEWLLERAGASSIPEPAPGALVRNTFRLNLRGADFHDDQGRPAALSDLALEHVDLRGARLEGVTFYRSALDGADFTGAMLMGANLSRTTLKGATFLRARLQGADLSEAQLQDATLRLASLEGADLRLANLHGTDLRGAHLEGADLRNAHLEGADLKAAHLEGKALRDTELAMLKQWRPHITAPLPAADLSSAYFDAATSLEGVTIGGEGSFVEVADSRWGGVNLAVIRWPQVPVLGDERAAWAEAAALGGTSSRAALRQYAAAVRANRQLAVVLREQGLNELADHFAYRAQRCQRIVLRRQGKQGARAWSAFLDLLAGYGYRPRRSFAAYVAVIFIFAALYLLLAPQAGAQLSPVGAVVFSMTSFHGRGFFPGTGTAHAIPLDSPFTVFAALEALVGLVIEVSLIATFTQRFFGR